MDHDIVERALRGLGRYYSSLIRGKSTAWHRRLLEQRRPRPSRELFAQVRFSWSAVRAERTWWRRRERNLKAMKRFKDGRLLMSGKPLKPLTVARLRRLWPHLDKPALHALKAALGIKRGDSHD